MCTIILPDAHVPESSVLVYLLITACERDDYKWLPKRPGLISTIIFNYLQFTNQQLSLSIKRRFHGRLAPRGLQDYVISAVVWFMNYVRVNYYFLFLIFFTIKNFISVNICFLLIISILLNMSFYSSGKANSTIVSSARHGFPGRLNE